MNAEVHEEEKEKPNTGIRSTTRVLVKNMSEDFDINQEETGFPLL